MKIVTTQLTISTRGKGLYAFTEQVSAWLERQLASHGIVTVFIQHTSASLVIQENADPDVTLDMRDFFERLVPAEKGYRHTSEGPVDMTSHIRSALTQSSLTVPVAGGRMTLGTWQGLYVFEHRTHPHRRTVVAQFMGE
ncbi:MAG: secondary thiamine-phosphate synthase enzyme YjbQ [Bryobacteraceae bacterium]